MKSAHRSTKMPHLVINDGEAVMDKIAITCEVRSDLDAAFLLTPCRLVADCLRTLSEFLQVTFIDFLMVFRQ
ncbi:MAG: hypothetical protein U5J62_05435 [Desulfurivibrio sp.]|nr:hypothetical protein [Desulfurivibrio sp.]